MKGGDRKREERKNVGRRKKMEWTTCKKNDGNWCVDLIKETTLWWKSVCRSD